MEELKFEIIRLVEKELDAGVAKWGLNHSNHESVAVFREEVEETADELNNLGQMTAAIWDMTKKNADQDTIRKAFNDAYNFAIATACEAIQAAAMARKGILSNIKIYDDLPFPEQEQKPDLLPFPEMQQGQQEKHKYMIMPED